MRHGLAAQCHSPAKIGIRMLALFAKKSVGALGLRCGASLAPLVDGSASLRAVAARGYASGECCDRSMSRRSWSTKCSGRIALSAACSAPKTQWRLC